MACFKMSRPTAPPDSLESDDIYSYAHLLGIPFETRREIYRHVLDNIHGERLGTWDQPQVSSYDGLRLCCKQLYLETAENLFQYRVAEPKVPTTLRLMANRTNFVQFRTLYLQLPLDYDRPLFSSLARFLQSFQLSIQELHLIFSGNDLYGSQVDLSSCGSRALNMLELSPLSRKGQQIEKKLCLMRLLPNLRNLRLLQIHNLHCAILKSSILQNKPYLQALRVTCDPRSAVADFHKLARSNPANLQGLIQPIQPPPPVEVLELDANAIVSVEDAINSLAPGLRHLGWRVPSADLHPRDRHRHQNCFYSLTERLMGTLWRLPDLETLRLCISIPEDDRNTWAGPDYASTVASGMSRYLPQCQNLKHLELHMTGAMPYVHAELVECISPSLQRLYLSHNTINVQTLITSIRSKLFEKPCHNIRRDSGVGLESAFLNGQIEDPVRDIWQQQPPQRASYVCWISVNDRGHVEYMADKQDGGSSSLVVIRKATPPLADFYDDIGMLGEFRNRVDRIPLHTGKLGFIACEYDHVEGEANDIEGGHSRMQRGESDRTKIFRLNGQLLDREHNLHLARIDGDAKRYGIRPAEQDQSETLEFQETSSTSIHSEILLGLQDPIWQPRCPFYIDKILKEVEVCFVIRDHWYFGHEQEAERVFWAEPVATHEGQKQKSILKEVEVVSSSRCQWMSPDAVVPPVGTFPLPVLPNDWKEDV